MTGQCVGSDAAPLPGVARRPSCAGARRLRRRGPRSRESLARRAERFKRQCPIESDPGKSKIETLPSEFKAQPLIFICVNIRSLKGKLDELLAVIQANDINMVLVQETWLDASYEHMVLPNFQVLARRDRSDGANRGGVISYIRSDLNNVIAYKESLQAERMWHLVQRDSGNVAICNWYLPPGNSLEELQSFKEELEEISILADSIIVAGDLNVHHKSWLKYSREDTSRGRELRDICSHQGLFEKVGKPTRGEYLLDLVLSNNVEVKARLGPKLADHSAILVTVPDVIEVRELPPRVIWQFDDANWEAIRNNITTFDWGVLKEGTVNDALAILVECLETQMQSHVPSKIKEMRKCTLP